MPEWKNERPAWCQHQDCKFKRRAQDAMCVGRLPKPEPHDGDLNYFRLCLNDGSIVDLLINKSDIYHFRRLFAALTEEP